MADYDRGANLNVPPGGRLTAAQILDYAKPPTSRAGGQNLGLASYQWATRPPDERFVTMEALLAATEARRDRSDEFPNVSIAGNLDVKYVEEGPLAGNLYAVSYGEAPAIFTNWSMSQFNSVVGGPDTRWLRDMPPPVAKFALNASIKYRQRIDGDTRVKLLAAPPAGDEPAVLRAVTGPDYGRIWDADIARTIMLINDGRWVVPGKVAGRGMADGYTEVTKQSTTLYASDRDMWAFLVDEQHPLQIGDADYFRGFIVSNSEVGDAKFKLLSFYFNRVCQNRCIWDAIGMAELSFRHSSKAPQRFLEEAAPVLAAYSNASVRGVEAAFAKAKTVTVGQTIKDAEDFLREQGFGQFDSKLIPVLAERATDVGSTGDPTSIYDLVMGATALARELVYADARVDYERRAGGLLNKYVRLN